MEVACRNKMKKTDLKQLIKPMVKECIHEVLIEEGLLSNVVAEVAKGMQASVITETKQIKAPSATREEMRQKTASINKKMADQKRKMMEAIGSDAYNGVNLFEGTTPTTAPDPNRLQGAPDLGAPDDSGVDISSLIGGASHVWKAIKEKGN